jgi:hypothetical protein
LKRFHRLSARMLLEACAPMRARARCNDSTCNHRVQAAEQKIVDPQKIEAIVALC